MKSEEVKKCKLCNGNCRTVFNLYFKETPICQTCANLITKQNVIWLINDKPRVVKTNIEARRELLEKLICKVNTKINQIQLMINTDEIKWQLKSLKGYKKMLEKELQL